MIFLTILFFFNFAVMIEEAKNFTKKGLRTSYFSTVIGISLVLFIIGLVIAGLLAIKSIQTQAKENLQGDIFFYPSLNNSDIKQIQLELTTWPEFKKLVFVSPQNAMDNFTETTQSKKQIFSIFEGENPIPPSIGYRPKEQVATKTGMMQLKKRIEKAYPDEVEEVSYNESSVEQVNLGFRQFVFLFLLVAGLLIVVAIAMINNTIRLALYSKRFTIKTMQLVGATAGFIRKPFLLNAVLQGVVSSIIGSALLLGSFLIASNLIDSIQFVFNLQLLLQLISILMLIGIFITVISTWISLRKYLRIKLDDLY
jgi:cell division transport system permease protein